MELSNLSYSNSCESKLKAIEMSYILLHQYMRIHLISTTDSENNNLNVDLVNMKITSTTTTILAIATTNIILPSLSTISSNSAQ